MNITELYSDEGFNDILVWIANTKKIIDFDDFRQDVFTEILEKEYTTMRDFKKAANNVAYRYYAAVQDVDFMDLALRDESGVIEADDETLSRLIYEGRAVKVC